MESAWLDSLSEDWVSQPAQSDRAPSSSAGSRPHTSNSIRSSVQEGSIHGSRIPVPTGRRLTSNQGPLSERNGNIPAAQGPREDSKAPRGIGRGRRVSRSYSVSTTESVKHYTVDKKSNSLSPRKRKPEEEPEWRRRLLHGDVAYGEQKDLFSAVGLESLFMPPPESVRPSTAPSPDRAMFSESVMPSSPPPYQMRVESNPNPTRRTASKAINYRLNEIPSDNFSDDLSQSSVFRPGKSVSTNRTSIIRKSTLNQPQLPQLDEDSDHEKQPFVDPGLSLRIPSQRFISGQSTVGHEDFSPVVLTRQSTVDGKMDYAPMAAGDLEQRLENLALHDDEDSSRMMGDMHSLPSDAAMTNDTDFLHNGHHIVVRRGGREMEGSFMHRPLSQSSAQSPMPSDHSAMLPDDFMHASTPKLFPSVVPKIRKTRASAEYEQSETISSPPGTPRTISKEERPTSKSSPLKLFGNYDTFTNQKLLRRLSQFECDALEEEDSVLSGIEEQDSKEEEEPATKSEINATYIAQTSPTKEEEPKYGSPKKSRGFTSFGEGELDEVAFEQEVNLPSWLSSEPESEDDMRPDSAETDKDRTQNSLFDFDRSVVTEEIKSRGITMLSKRSSLTLTHSKPMLPRDGPMPNLKPRTMPPAPISIGTPKKASIQYDVHGKRLQSATSPVKDPTPKRRRTFHEKDIEKEQARQAEAARTEQEIERRMQPSPEWRRKETALDKNRPPLQPTVSADKEDAAMIDSLGKENQAPRPSPRPQMSFKEHEEQGKKIAQIQAELDQAPAEAPLMAPGVKKMVGQSRKGSITTNDFFNEAAYIMKRLRQKTRASGVSSMEASQSDITSSGPGGGNISSNVVEDDSFDDSSMEPFDRPPSRVNGGEVPRLPKEQSNPDLLKHLQQYEERSDFETMAASIRTAYTEDQDDDDTQHHHSELQPTSKWTLNDNEPYESDLPNVRITHSRERGNSASSAPGALEDQLSHRTHGTNALSNSTGGTYPTGTSQQSHSRRVIPPDAVAHLIPPQMAGMVFDHERHGWYKRKTVYSSASQASFTDDEDPFGDIPDLTVDEIQEQQRLKAVQARQVEENRLAVVQEYQKSSFGIHQNTNLAFVGLNNAAMDRFRSSLSDPSKFVRRSSDLFGPETETRATSWNQEDDNTTEQGPAVPVHGMVKQIRNTTTSTVSTNYQEPSVNEPEDEDVEEISIHESRIEPTSPAKTPHKRRVTISFSSPLVQQPQCDYFEEHSVVGDIYEQYYGDDDATVDDSMVQSPHEKQTAQLRQSYRPNSRRRSSSSIWRPMSAIRKVSRIVEQDEDPRAQFEDSKRQMSVVISTPMPAQRNSNAQVSGNRAVSQELARMEDMPQPVHRDANGLYQLSPMSEFTMNRSSEESFAFEVSYVATSRPRSNDHLPVHHEHPDVQHKRTLSIHVQELVQRITDVEPHELYWSHIKLLELKNKRLQSLHKLDRFCEELEELDASENQIAQLDGAPEGIRTLRVNDNLLSDLTSWQHMRNLQYVDVSNNELTNLDGLKDLVHLRNLKADDNKLRDISGIFELDGLLGLRLRNNDLESLDFTGSRLQRLTDLDLKGNKLEHVAGLYELTALGNLHLEDNSLEAFQPSETLWSLKYLKLSGNHLTSLEVSLYPNLRLLYLDRNRLGSITGLLKTKHLDSLSLREQREATLDMAFLNQCFEIRKLFLSGNLLTSFDPEVEFLNLQYLEIANCGLADLPRDIDALMRNMRVLNANFNAIKDLKPLLGMTRLKRLSIAGNRLQRLRRTCSILGCFPALNILDVRDNPLTLGFYSSMTSTALTIQDNDNSPRKAITNGCAKESEPADKDQEPFQLREQETKMDTKYHSRLDLETKMRRRLYELMVVHGGPRLRKLDGMPVPRDAAGLPAVVSTRDEVFDGMVKRGLIVPTQTQPLDIKAPHVVTEAENEKEATRSLIMEMAGMNVSDTKSPEKAKSSAKMQQRQAEENRAEKIRIEEERARAVAEAAVEVAAAAETLAEVATDAETEKEKERKVGQRQERERMIKEDLWRMRRESTWPAEDSFA